MTPPPRSVNVNKDGVEAVFVVAILYDLRVKGQLIVDQRTSGGGSEVLRSLRHSEVWV